MSDEQLGMKLNRIDALMNCVSPGSAEEAEYLALLEGEITAARMILTGRLAGIEPEVIRERLRDINA